MVCNFCSSKKKKKKEAKNGVKEAESSEIVWGYEGIFLIRKNRKKQEMCVMWLKVGINRNNKCPDSKTIRSFKINKKQREKMNTMLYHPEKIDKIVRNSFQVCPS